MSGGLGNARGYATGAWTLASGIQLPAEAPPDPRASVDLVTPPAALEGLVDLITVMVTPHSVSTKLLLGQLPAPGAQVILTVGDDLEAALLVIPAQPRLTMLPPTTRQLVAVSLSPTGLRLLAPRGGLALKAQDPVALEHFWGRAARALLHDLLLEPQPYRRALALAGALEARSKRIDHAHPVARRATSILVRERGGISLGAIAASCRCSRRTLLSVVSAETGLGPKHLARILRLRHAVALIAAGRDLDEIAAEARFSDQSHMTREFRAMVLQSPRRLAKRLLAAPGLGPGFSDRSLLGAGFVVAQQ